MKTKFSKFNIALIIAALWLFVLSFFFLNINKGGVSYTLRIIGENEYVSGFPVYLKLAARSNKKYKPLRVFVKKCQISMDNTFSNNNCSSENGAPAILKIDPPQGKTGNMQIKLTISVEGEVRDVTFSVNIVRCLKTCNLEEQLKIYTLKDTPFKSEKGDMIIKAFPFRGFFSETFPQHVWFSVNLKKNNKTVSGKFVINDKEFVTNSKGVAHALIKLKQMKNSFSFTFYPDDKNLSPQSGKIRYSPNLIPFSPEPIGFVPINRLKKNFTVKINKKKWVKKLFCDIYLDKYLVYAGAVEGYSVSLPDWLKPGLYTFECNEHYLVKNNIWQNFIVSKATDLTQFFDLKNVKNIPLYTAYLLTRMNLKNKGKLSVLLSTENQDKSMFARKSAKKRLLITAFLVLSFIIILAATSFKIVKDYLTLKKSFEEVKLNEDFDEIDEITRKKFFYSFFLVLLIIVVDVAAFIWLLYFISSL